MLGPEGSNRLGCDLRMRGVQPLAQAFGAGRGVFDRGDQDGDGFHRGRQGHGPLRRSGPLGHLRLRPLGIGGQIDKVALVFLALEIGMLVKVPEEGAGIQPQALPQFGSGQSCGRLLDQRHQRLGQMAKARKADFPMKPEPVFIELREVGQGVKATIEIETGQAAPGFEAPPDGPHRSVEVVGEIGEGEDFTLAPPAEEAFEEVHEAGG